MNKFPILIIALCIAVIGIGGFYIFGKPSSQPIVQTDTKVPQPLITNEATQTTQGTLVDYKTAFAIYTNGIFRVFTASMYHNLSKDVYIQADNPNIVHVKKSGITWDYFFKTLPFSVTKDCLITGTKETFCTNQTKTLKFYLNGIKTENLLDTEIKPNDKALITYGGEKDSETAEQLEKLSSIFK